MAMDEISAEPLTCTPDEPIIAVAVDGTWKGIYPVKWAVENLLTQGSTLHLIHVYSHPQSIMLFPWRVDPSMLDPVAKIPEEETNCNSVSQMNPVWQLEYNPTNMNKYTEFCKIRKIKPVVSLLQSDSIGQALVNHITQLQISKIVIGNGTSSLVSQWSITELARYVQRYVPDFCEVLPIYKDEMDSKCKGGIGSDPLPVSIGYVYETRSRSKCPCAASIEADQSSTGSIEPSLEKVQLEVVKQGVNAFGEPKKEADMAWQQVATLSTELAIYLAELEKTKKDLKMEIQLHKDAEEKSLQDLVSKEEELEKTKNDLGTEIQQHKDAEAKVVQEFLSKQKELEDTKKDSEAEIKLRLKAEKKALRKLASVQEELENTKEALEMEIKLGKDVKKKAHKKLVSKQQELENIKVDLEEDVQLSEDAKKRALRRLTSTQEELTNTKKNLEAEIQRHKDTKKRAHRKLESKQEELDKTLNSLKMEIQSRQDAEEKALREAVSKQEILFSFKEAHIEYTKYDFQEIQEATNNFSTDLNKGEDGSASVYEGRIRYTVAAIKVLKEGLQGSLESQCQIELLSQIHHPHVLTLLGACPEKACFVYEYMANGSVEDCLIHRPEALPSYIRFRVCSEVASALMFLRSSQPEPIIHSHLKLGNIFLDQNFVSKISDVGMSRFFPNNVISNTTDCSVDTLPDRIGLSTDPPHQPRGKFCPQSDLHALGMVILQILTGMQPDNLTDKVKSALQNKKISTVLDTFAGDWPIHEATELGLLALQCASYQTKDHVDLPIIISLLQNTQRVAAKAASKGNRKVFCKSLSKRSVPELYICPISQEVMKDPHIAADGFTYDRKNIEQWISNHRTSPMTNMPLDHKILTPNRSLRSAIQDWESEA